MLHVDLVLRTAAVVQGYNLAVGLVTPPLLVAANLLLISALSLAAMATLAGLRPASWLKPDVSADTARRLGPVEQQVLAALREAFDQEQVYREEGLTIGRLATRLGTREHVLRRVINQGLGHRNFNDFLHSYRIREACARLRRPEQARRPVLSVALDVGYGSIGPFNAPSRRAWA